MEEDTSKPLEDSKAVATPSDSSDDKPNDNLVSRSELNEAIKRRDNALKERASLKARLEELEAKQSEGNKNKAANSKDFEAYKIEVDAEIARYKDEAKEAKEQAKKLLVKQQVETLAREHLTDKGVEVFMLKHGGSFVLDGEQVKLKDSPKAISELVSDFSSGWSELAKPTTGTGSGVKTPGSQNFGSGIPADFHSWSKERKSEFMKTNPDLAKQALDDAVKRLSP